MEIWKDIAEFEGLYQVSNYGRVRSLNYLHTGRSGVLSPGKNRYGYLQVDLWKNGKRKPFKVHRLVAETFISNLLDYPEVNHIDENKENNRVENLEWVEHKENCNHGTRNQRVAEKRSKPVLQLTLTGELIREWPSIREAGRNGFDLGAVFRCCRGKQKTHHGFRWEYK